MVGAIGRGRCGAAVGRGAAGGVGNVHPVAEELGDELDIGGFTATGTGAGKFKVGFCKLGVFDGLAVGNRRLNGHLFDAESPIVGLLHLRGEGLHDQRFLLRRADVDTAAAACAVVGRNLNAELITAHVLAGGLLRFEAGRCRFGFGFVEQNRPNGRMGADQRTVIALDALGKVPFRHFHSRTAFFVFGGPGRPSPVLETVFGHLGHRQRVAFLTVHRRHHFFDKIRHVFFGDGIFRSPPAFGNIDLHKGIDALFNGRVVHIDHLLALFLEIGLIVGVLHFPHGLLDGNHAGKFEEGRLQNGIGSAAESQLAGDVDGVDGVELSILFSQLAFHARRQMGFEPVHIPLAIEQEGAAGLQVFHHVVVVNIGRIVAGHEIRRLNQIRRMDRILPKAQVRLGQPAGFL